MNTEKRIITPDQKFRTGDIVAATMRHNSLMTVKQYNKENQVICNWFTENVYVHEEPFNESELTLVKAYAPEL